MTQVKPLGRSESELQARDLLGVNQRFQLIELRPVARLGALDLSGSEA